MKLIQYNSRSNTPVAVALGYFDCLHLGHRKLLSAARGFAVDGVGLAMFTFDNSPSEILKTRSNAIYDFETRCDLACEAGVEVLIHAHFDERLRALSSTEFLKNLFSTADVRAVVCGLDYRYGHLGEGNSTTLAAECARRGIVFLEVSDEMRDGEKVSSTKIRTLLTEGDIEKANELLGQSYRMTGTVSHGRGEGRVYNTPTANLVPSDRLIKLRAGVYAAYVAVDRTRYKAITNVGAKPTFDDHSYTVESFLDGTFDSLYGKRITVEFEKRLRDIKKFDSKEELYAQIQLDKEQWL